MKALETLKGLLDGVESVEIEIIPAKNKEEIEDTNGMDLSAIDKYFLDEVSKGNMGSTDLPNQMLALQVYDKFKSVDVSKVNAKALFEDLKKVGQMPIDRSNIEQRVAAVADNAVTIACALDNYNPDIIDSMIRMEVVEVALKENMSEDVAKLGEIETVKNQEYVDTIFKALFKSATAADFRKKIGSDD